MDFLLDVIIAFFEWLTGKTPPITERDRQFFNDEKSNPLNEEDRIEKLRK